MQIAFSLLAGLTTAQNVRRLIIDGPIDSLAAHPHAVAILYCNPPTAGTYSCGIHCSGSLIAPNVVLSAAHCIKDTGLAFGDTSVYVDYSKLYVLAGSTDYDTPDWSRNSKLVRVKHAVTAGYGDNVRFPMDGDASLLELVSCIDEIPGQIEYAKVATIETEPIGDNCQLSTVAGFGIISNAPDDVRDDDGKRRIASDIVHSYEVCRDSYIAGAYDWETATEGTPAQSAVDTIIPEVYVCMGGSSIQSVCFGDSGSGYAVELTNSSKKQLIGVVSFGIGQFCTTSADYSTRLSFRAPWMVEQMSNFTTCPNWEWSASFASWPVQAWNSSQLSTEYSSSRCSSSSEWQCRSGECIPRTSVCDGTNNCSDGSDEYDLYCIVVSMSAQINAPDALLFNQMNMINMKAAPDAELQNELDALLSNKGIGAPTFSETTFDLKKPDESVVNDGTTVVIAGVLKFAGNKVRLVHQKSSNESVESAPEVSPKSNPAPIDCTTAMKDYNTALQDAINQNTINDQWDPTRLANACQYVPTCTGTRPSASVYRDSKNTCEQLTDFMAWNVTLPVYAANFNKNFNAYCTADELETTAIPTGRQANGQSGSTTKNGRHLNAIFNPLTFTLPILIFGL